MMVYSELMDSCAWRQVTKLWAEELWAEELEERPKLRVLKELVGRGFDARCVG